ncbi:MAG: tyrosine-type recombinase/integrase [Bacteroidia bacterium]
MPLPGQKTTTSFLEWETTLTLISKLERDRDFKFALLIACGAFTGLRISDLLSLTWADILEKEDFTLNERKTKKTRRIKVNPQLKEIAERLHIKSGQPLVNELMFINRYGTQAIRRHYVNSKLKTIMTKYKIKVSGNVSSHMLRKTLGRRFMEKQNYSDHALILLSEVYNHSSVSITRRYLGLRQEEIASVYDDL